MIFAAVCLAGFFLQMNPIAMGQALLTAAQGSEGLSKAAGVLDMLLRFPGLIYEFTGFGTWAFFIALLVTEGIFALVSRILWKMFMPEKIDDEAYAKAADAYNTLNAQYKNMAVEYQTARKEWLEISKQWNTEYHRVLKAKGVKIRT